MFGGKGCDHNDLRLVMRSLISCWPSSWQASSTEREEPLIEFRADENFDSKLIRTSELFYSFNVESSNVRTAESARISIKVCDKFMWENLSQTFKDEQISL